MVSSPDKKSKVKPRIYHQKKQPLQEIYGEGENDPDGFDEEHGDE